MSVPTDDMPLHLRIKTVLKDFPQGLTSRELAEKVGRWQPTVSACVSKIHNYGGPIEKIGAGYGAGTKWRLREAAPS
jgi:DNA-binding Lrp family transcriptional regulator